MSNQRPQLTAESRDRTGSRYALRLRRGGKLPAVIYGHGQAPAHVALDAEAIEQVLHDGTHLLDVQVTGQKLETCLIKDIQYDFLGNYIIHVDLARVDLSDQVDVNVPMVLKGQDRAPGMKVAGAILEHPLADLHVKCRADAIPHEIFVDISNLEAGKSMTVGDLQLPEGVVALHDRNAVVAHISIAGEEEPVAQTAEGVAEPEVITKSKEEEAKADSK